MGLFNSIRLGSSAAGDYEVERSLRFVGEGTHHYLERTPSSAGNRQICTFSCWTKRSNIDVSHCLASAYSGNNDNDNISLVFRSLGSGNCEFRVVGYANNFRITNRKFRDVSAWYHIVVAFDTTQSSADDRIKVYVNGVQETSFSTSGNVTQNMNIAFNAASVHRIGTQSNSLSNTADGYIAEVNFIDGSQLTPSSFAETDVLTGEYKPKKYIGGYGTNGFYLNFSDNSGTTATTLGKDSSGNGNNFTPNNFGTGDAVKDSSTNNFCSFIGILPTAQTTLAEGNLKMTVIDSHKTVYGNHGLRSGKWYWEGLAIAGSATKWTYGVSDILNTLNTQTTNNNMLLGVEPAANYAYGDVVSIYNTNLYKNGSNVSSSYQTNPSAGDIIGIALDVDTGKVWFARNGTWINGSASASTTLDTSNHDTTVATGKVYTPAYSAENVSWQANFGQDSSFSNAKTAQGNTDGNGVGDFYYAVPSGFKAICSANLPDPTIAEGNKHFDTLLWTGDGASSKAITGLNFTPDFVWTKRRSGTDNHHAFDSVRGASSARLFVNTNAVEDGNFGSINSFNSNGITVGANVATNANGETFVAWNWKGGGSASSNTNGSITSSVSANTTAGFSILTYTGTGSQTTVGHGLGVAPKVIITKLRDTNTQDWMFYPKQLTGTGGTYIKFNEDNAVATDAHTYPNVEPTSTVYTVGGDDGGDGTNGNGKAYVAYCFSEVAGYSEFGTYTGNNNADGPFVFTGFRPAWILIKSTGGSTNWELRDSTRNPYNPSNIYISPNLSGAEGTTSNHLDFLSNGFKIRAVNHDSWNNDGQIYMYMAFAESPFKYSRAR